MKRYNITNLITGNQYAITDADLERFGQSITERVAVKTNAYGHQERRFPAAGEGWSIEQGVDGLEHVTAEVEVTTYTDMEGIEQQTDPVPEIRRPLQEVRPEWYRVAEPTLDGLEVVVPAEHTIVVEDISAELHDRLQTEANHAAWGYIFASGHDQGGLMQLIRWLDKTDTPQAAKTMILAVEAWKDAVMDLYYVKKNLIATEQPYDLDYSSIGPCPHKFSAIREVIYNG